MTDFEQNISSYIDYYDWEKCLFANGIEWKKKGWLKKAEFLEICLWKSRRPRRFYEQNDEQSVIKITGDAFHESDEKRRIAILIQLDGVNIPTASAILSITDPDLYPIIDIRCVETLNDLNLISWRQINVRNWESYLQVVREIANRNGLSARAVEKGLFAYNRVKLDRQLKNLYNYGKIKTTDD